MGWGHPCCKTCHGWDTAPQPHWPLAQPCHRPWPRLTIKTLLKVPTDPASRHSAPHACTTWVCPTPLYVSVAPLPRGACGPLVWRPRVAKPLPAHRICWLFLAGWCPLLGSGAGGTAPRHPGTLTLAGGLLGRRGHWWGGSASRHVPPLLALQGSQPARLESGPYLCPEEGPLGLAGTPKLAGPGGWLPGGHGLVVADEPLERSLGVMGTR